MSLALGIPVAELQSRMSSREFAEWLAYDRIDPYGQERGDLQAAIIASTTASCAPVKHKKRPRPIDFMPKFGKPKPTLKQQFLALCAVADAQAGRANP